MEVDDKIIVKSSKKSKKETKWNRISKKYQNTNVTTETVKTFLDKNYIAENVEKNLSGSVHTTLLDPVLVMDLRHQAISRKSEQNKTYSPVIDAQKSIQCEKRENHNRVLENIAIDTEIKKFQNELNKYKKPTNQQNHNQQNKTHKNHDFTINNQNLYENLLNFETTSNDFYRTCIKAPLLGMGDSLNDEDAESEDDEDDGRTTIRMVRFEETIKIVNYRCEERYIESTITDGRRSPSNHHHILNLISLFRDDNDVGNVNEDYYVNDDSPSISMSSETLHDDGDLEEITYRSIFAQDNRHQTCPSTSSSVDDMISDEESNTLLTVIDSPRFTEIVDEEPMKSIFEESGLIITRAGVERPNVPKIQNNVESSLDGAALGDDDELNDETTERNQIITELFDEKYYQATRDYELKVLRKYFLKWSVMTTIEKVAGNCLTNSKSRVTKITGFLNKIREEKRALHEADINAQAGVKKPKKIDPVLLSKRYQHKCKYQQEIIDLQKLKLERQERMITELKLSKMFEESKHSKMEMKTELRHIIQHGTVKIRAKAKCLQITGNLKEDEDDDMKELRKLQASGNEAPKFLARMQARAMERHQKHEEVKEKRARLEKEREEAKIAVEDAKRQEDEQAKRERFDALREKRRQEKLQKIQRENDRQKYFENMQKVNDYRRLKLLKCYGFDQFKKLIVIKRYNVRKAKILRRTQLSRNVFRAWHNLTLQIWEAKKRKADKFCLIYTQRVAYRMWMNTMMIAQSKEMVAIDLYELRLMEKVICLWSSHTKCEKMIDERKMKQAKMHYDFHLLWKGLEHWRRLHTILKIEKDTEERRQRWRIKIWELLPDYQPNTE